MARIFLSHSSADNAQAVVLRDWLAAEGWDDIFLDLDPNRGLVAGERWERALNEAANRCEAVLFLLSKAWLGSGWCRKELNLAHRLNKRLFGVLIEDIPVGELPADLTVEWQLVRLAAGRDHKMFRATLPITGEEVHVTFSAEGLMRLRSGLQRAGLDARFFAWPPASDPDRPPYRGLRPLEAEDAGIFFGRDAPIVTALDALRGLREAAAPRLFVILGASGAGKSSFLRAGLIPRLQRDDRNFLTLPIVRPERAALSGATGLVVCLETALKTQGLARTRAELKAIVGGGAEAVLPVLEALAEKVRIPALSDETESKTPTLILPIDQGEEMFPAEGAEEAAALLALLRDLLLATSVNIIVLVTIRTNAYEPLQTAKALDGLHQVPFDLAPMPRGAYAGVIEGPAERLESSSRPLRIEPAVTQALLDDVEAGGGKDALPLLAFTLERLYIEHGGDGDLNLAEYEQLGRIKGSIEAAVERALAAADADPTIPRERAARLALLRRGLIPWLAGIDPETQAPRRRVARMSEIPAEALPLIRHLVAQRLLATDVAKGTGEATIEPAHEALLRQWGLLHGWLEDDFAALMLLEAVKRAARDWAANAKQEAWLAHTGARLEEAERVAAREEFSRFVEPTERAYLAACHEREAARLRREHKLRRRFVGALLGLLLVIIAALASALWNIRMSSEREAGVFASLAAQANQDGHYDRAVRYALAGLPPKGSLLFLQTWSHELDASLAAAAVGNRLRAILQGHSQGVVHAIISSDGRRIVTSSEETTARLWDADKVEVVAELQGHGEAIKHVAFSADGARVVTSSMDKTARVWDAANGAAIAVLAGHAGDVVSAEFSPDRAFVVTASKDKTARLWDARTGSSIRVLAGHSADLRMAIFGPDGTKIATAADDKTARLWERDSGRELHVLAGHQLDVMSVAFSHDGSRLASASADKSARVWNTSSGVEIAVLSGHGAQVSTAEFSPDGSLVLTASHDATARLWDARNGKAIRTLQGHKGPVWSASFSPDGRRIVTASEDPTARLWDTESGTEIAVLRGHEDSAWSAVFSADGKRMVTASKDKTARLWDATPRPGVVVLKGHDGQAWRARFSADGGRIVTASQDTTARLWDGKSGGELAVLRGHTRIVQDAAFSPDGRQVVTASDDQTARIWDARTGAVLFVLEGHRHDVFRGAFSPDGRSIVTASADKTARLWDATGGAPLGVLGGHADVVLEAVFSPDGRHVATASADGTARLWEVRTGAEVAVLRGHDGPLWSIAYSPSGDRLLTASADATARVWDARTGAAVAVLRGHAQRVWQSSFSPDGKKIVTSSEDKTARVWDAASGEPITMLKGHTDSVRGAVFSPDGGRIATASSDRTARIWDASTGTEITVLRGHTAWLYAPALNKDATRLLTPSGDYSARLWDVTEVMAVDGPTLRDRICAGALFARSLLSFTDPEMQVAVLRGRDDMRSPCARRGPLSIEYYWK